MTHKEKLQEAKRLYETANADQRYVLESLFPELRESEDERIRKEFCKDIWTFIPNEKAHKYITWLEKQGEKPVEEMKEALRTEYEKGRADAIAEMQKPAWSEEDENIVEDIKEAVINTWCGDTQDIILDWLKSLKDRYAV